MAKKLKSGTLSTKRSAVKSLRQNKDQTVSTKMKQLLGLHKLRFHPHANKRMGERKVLYYEVLQALGTSRHEPNKDRYSQEHESWEYSFFGNTIDKRRLRIGVTFEIDIKSEERLLVITVIDPDKEDA